MAGGDFFKQFEQETGRTPEERLNRLINAIRNSGSDLEYFSWEMNYNLAQFNQAQVVIMAAMILEMKSFQKVYDYFLSADYGKVGVIALEAGHATDRLLIPLSDGFKDTRNILEENGGIVTSKLKEKIVSIISVNLLFDALKLVYSLFGLNGLMDGEYVDEINKDSIVNIGKTEIKITTLQRYLEEDIFDIKSHPDNDFNLDVIGKRLWDASSYCISRSQAHFNAMTADRRERKGSPYSTTQYKQFIEKTNEDINEILEYDYFKI
ncbi:MAG: hypothetical protein ABIM99_01860 [Candidatus Dojkabacteria bacterium]